MCLKYSADTLNPLLRHLFEVSYECIADSNTLCLSGLDCYPCHRCRFADRVLVSSLGKSKWFQMLKLEQCGGTGQLIILYIPEPIHLKPFRFTQ